MRKFDVKQGSSSLYYLGEIPGEIALLLSVWLP